MNSTLIAALLVGGGLAMVVVGYMSRVYARERELFEILDLPYGEQDLPIEAIAERSAIVEGTVAFAGQILEQVDAKGALLRDLEQARIPMRPGEFIIVAGSASIVFSAFILAITETLPLAVAALLAGGFVARAYVKRRIRKRQRALEEQLPDAISLIAGSLSAGHTFLRAIQMMSEEANPPISDELNRVVAETQLGAPVVDAIERMAARVQIRDLDWVVQAIKIQQTVGGKLADLLHVMADFMREREQIRREIKALTAEGMASAYILGALPFVMATGISITSPGYLDPLFSSSGLFWVAGAMVSLFIGFQIIVRMVKSVDI